MPIPDYRYRDRILGDLKQAEEMLEAMKRQNHSPAIIRDYTNRVRILRAQLDALVPPDGNPPYPLRKE